MVRDIRMLEENDLVVSARGGKRVPYAEQSLLPRIRLEGHVENAGLRIRWVHARSVQLSREPLASRIGCRSRPVEQECDHLCHLASQRYRDQELRGREYDESAMDESSTTARIEQLVSEEHRLWTEAERERLDDAGHRKLERIRGELDRCWDALRRRRANPDVPEPRERVPDPPNEFEGPEPEPHHLEHGLHGEGPDPDPDIPRDIP
jgi:hypothetical protein